MRMLGVLAVGAVLCGCFNIQQQGSNNVTISGQAIGGGSDTKAVKCASTATVATKWSGSAGTLEVALFQGSASVMDVSYAATAAEQTASNTFPAGEYDLVVSRSSDWNGSYEVKVSCQ